MRQVAIVGSGPSGCYLAEALLRAKDVRVDIIDRLPTPFGLVRFGVAPDHQATKGVTRLLERVLAKPEVSYFGGVELDRDVSLDELRNFYDAVVIATGAPLDRRLDIPGEALPGVYSSGRFVGWYNHHPDHAALDLSLVDSAIVIGNGNVALDVARILAKSEAEFEGSDLDPEVAATIAGSGVRHIRIVGRRSAEHLKFSEQELSELGELSHARPVLASRDDLAGVPGKSADTLREICARTYEGERVVIEFVFGLTPVAFEGDNRLAAIRFARADGTGQDVVFPAQLAVTCIGYESTGHGLAVDGGAMRNDDGRIEDGLYVVGWAKRGPSGTIPTNRAEAQLLAKKIASEVSDGSKPGTAGLHETLRARPIAHVDYAGWQRIDASEIARADATRSRRKWRSLDELLAAAKAGD
jgi:NADPH-dependent glutamate synthase beta subunit-like oxidoreductase